MMKRMIVSLAIGISACSLMAETAVKTECKVIGPVVKVNEVNQMKLEVLFADSEKPANYMIQGIKKNLPPDFLKHVKPDYIWKNNKNHDYDRYNLGGAPFSGKIRSEKKGTVTIHFPNYPKGKYELNFVFFSHESAKNGKPIVKQTNIPLSFTVE